MKKITMMENMTIPSIFWTFLFLTDSVSSTGFFYIQRNSSFCVNTTFNVTTTNTVVDNCFIFDWQQMRNATSNYTTYMLPNTNVTYYLKIGALTVLGTINNYDFDYHCPPSGYNGVGPGCQTPPDTHLVILHINAQDEKLYAIDIILSGHPFPSLESLVDNQPPFGKATHKFDEGVTIQSTGYFSICKSNNSNRCPNQNIDTHKLPHPLPSNTGFGMFGIQASGLVTNSLWIMDDVNQLLIVTAGNFYYYFNATGFFMYKLNSNTCIWLSSCNYRCEVYNYNSRFLDYAGEWIITKKWGIDNIKPTVVQAWIGNANDAAGVFPTIMYMDNVTGHYIGLDKLDTKPGVNMGAAYWYIAHDNTIPASSINNFHPNVAEVGCTSKLSEWTGLSNKCEMMMRLKNIRMMIILLFFINIFSMHQRFL